MGRVAIGMDPHKRSAGIVDTTPFDGGEFVDPAQATNTLLDRYPSAAGC
jgi:hypothetical protein